MVFEVEYVFAYCAAGLSFFIYLFICLVVADVSLARCLLCLMHWARLGLFGRCCYKVKHSVVVDGKGKKKKTNSNSS